MVLVTTIPAQKPKPEWLFKHFCSLAKMKRTGWSRSEIHWAKKTKKIHNTNLRSCKFLRRAKMFLKESKMESGDPWFCYQDAPDIQWYTKMLWCTFWAKMVHFKKTWLIISVLEMKSNYKIAILVPFFDNRLQFSRRAKMFLKESKREPHCVRFCLPSSRG